MTGLFHALRAPFLTVGLLFLTLSSSAASATSDLVDTIQELFHPSREQADQHYNVGQYDSAAQKYQKAIEDDPANSQLAYNLGDADYKAGKYPEAEEAFQRALSSPDPQLQGNAYYNLGNAQYKHGESLEETDPHKAMELMQKSIESYDASMLRTPSDDARHNQQVVKHRLDQLKAEQKAREDAKKAKDSQSQSQSGGQNQSASAPQTKKDQSGQGDQNSQANGQPNLIDQAERGQQGQPQNGQQSKPIPNGQQTAQQQGQQTPQQQNGQQGQPDQNNNQTAQQSPAQQPNSQSGSQIQPNQQSPKDQQMAQNSQSPQNGQPNNGQPPPLPQPQSDQLIAGNTSGSQTVSLDELSNMSMPGSGARDIDKVDPGTQTKAQAEALLDTMKSEEKHITARTFNRNKPTPTSGRDW